MQAAAAEGYARACTETRAVEEITGRRVLQFMSQVSFEPDMAAEIFVLEPLSAAEPASAAPS